MAAPRSTHLSLVLSLALHLVAFYLVGRHWEEIEDTRMFRAYFARRPRFEPPPPFPKPDQVQAQMEYLRPIQPSAPVVESEPALSPSQPVPLQPEGPTPLQPLGLEPGGPPKPATPLITAEQRPSVAGPVWVDSLESEAMELLRIEDMARVDDKRAVIIPDQYSRRDLEGFINFTYLSLDGIGNRGGPLESLARYLRDHTKIRAQVRGVPKPYFLSEQLLKDPIHFMFPGPRLSGDRQRRTYLSPEELALLSRYIREGGFLFIEGSSTWLMEMIIYLYQISRPNGRLFEIPFTHPIYHSFYEFNAGFPGGENKDLLGVPLPTWYFAKGAKDRRGLWGVELNGQLVAVFSDMGLADVLPAAVNITVYALTRPGGLTAKRRPSAWKNLKPPVPVATAAFNPTVGPDEPELFDDLEATLALVHLPLSAPIDLGRLRLSLDGRHRVELLQPGKNGLLVHNLTPGHHWIEVEYGDQKNQIEVDLLGGRVVTVGFRLERLGFIQRLKLKQRPERPLTQDWRQRFANLEMEPVFFQNPALLELLDD